MAKVMFFSFQKIESWKKKILKKHPEWIEDSSHPDYVFVVGGDGTFLAALKQFYNQKLKLVLINAGHLGYLANFSVDDSIVDLEQQEWVHYPYLEISCEEQKAIGINELWVYTNQSSLNWDVYLNDEYFYTFFGSGALVSTALGSSGVNRSFNGALLKDPKTYLFSEFAPSMYINNAYLGQNLVLTSNDKIRLSPDLNALSSQSTLKIDGQLMNWNLQKMDLVLKQSRSYIIDCFNTQTWIQRIKNKLLGHFYDPKNKN